MNASATSDFSPPDSSDRRLLDLPGGRDLDLDARLGLLARSLRRRARPPSGGSSPRDHGARPVALDQPQLPAAAGEQVLHDVLEVPRGGLEGLLEALADAPVGLRDQALELGQRGLQVGALLLELLHVGDRLVVLLLGQRVDRAELLAPAGQALDARDERLALLVRQRLGGGLGVEAERRGDRGQLALDLGGRVAHLLRRHLGARDAPRWRP